VELHYTITQHKPRTIFDTKRITALQQHTLHTWPTLHTTMVSRVSKVRNTQKCHCTYVTFQQLLLYFSINKIAFDFSFILRRSTPTQP
jgi:hypothetical protein